MSETVTCDLCGHESGKNDFYSVCSGGNTTYECVEEDECKKNAQSYQKERREKNILEAVTTNNYDKLNPPDHFEAKYGLSFKDLKQTGPIITHIMCPTYSLFGGNTIENITLEHKTNGDTYTWNSNDKTWTEN